MENLTQLIRNSQNVRTVYISAVFPFSLIYMAVQNIFQNINDDCEKSLTTESCRSHANDELLH